MHYKVKKRIGQEGWALLAWEHGKERYVPKASWPAGLSSTMPLESARTYVKTLNASKRLAPEEARRLKASERHIERLKIQNTLLPTDCVLQFERNNLLFLPIGDVTRQKRENIWKNVQLLIAELSIHPSDWCLSPDPIYYYMANKKWSWDYCKRIVSVLNKYGHIYCRVYDKAFSPIELSDQKKKVQIEVAFGEGEESEPLSVFFLSTLKLENQNKWNWLFITFWFGLRPHETDLLKIAKSKDGMDTWWTEDKETTLVLYQPKLTKVKPKKRYKRIPIRFSEQQYALELIQIGAFTRPTQREVRKWLPEGVSLYGCRHGFACLMDKIGIDIYAISRWLGHQSVTTTERYYVRLGLRRD